MPVTTPDSEHLATIHTVSQANAKDRKSVYRGRQPSCFNLSLLTFLLVFPRLRGTASAAARGSGKS